MTTDNIFLNSLFYKKKSFEVNSNIFATHSFLQNENHAPVETGVAISVTREFYLLKFVEKTRESSSDAKVRHLDSRELIIINFQPTVIVKKNFDKGKYMK